MPLLRCEIVRWVSADPFPGWVEARLMDSDGREWRFCDKPPIFSAELFTSEQLPMAGTIACDVIAVDEANGTATVNTSAAWGVEATDGTTTFRVMAEQLVGDEGPSREPDDAVPLCPRCGGTGVDAGALRKKRNSPRISRAHFDAPPCPDCLGSGELNDDKRPHER